MRTLLGPGPLPLQQRPKGSELPSAHMDTLLNTEIRIVILHSYDCYVQFSSVQSLHLSYLLTQFLDNCSGFVCLFFNLSFFSLAPFTLSASENSTEISLRSEWIFSSSLRPSKISLNFCYSVF